jgi:hypothetical protein
LAAGHDPHDESLALRGEASPDESQGVESRPVRRIRIGSQRPGSRPIRLDREPTRGADAPAPSHSVGIGPGEAASQTPTVDTPTSAPAGAAPAAALLAAASAAATPQAAVVDAAPADLRPNPPALGKPGRKPQGRHGGKPGHAAAAEAEQNVGPVSKAPRPNIRQPLSADLEQELAEALGDGSLDDMLQPLATSAGEAELEVGSRAAGRVVSVHRDSVFLDLGGRRQGVLSLAAFLGDHEAAPTPEAGQVLQVTIARFNANDGLYEVRPA